MSSPSLPVSQSQGTRTLSSVSVSGSHDSAKVSLSFSLQPRLFLNSFLSVSPNSPSFPPGK
ncbi:hypothetical protein MTR_0368s0040 [Medicago truncatula]|uniref:Uncharacterized protein n=1 Tax=Medicago truncatula TaxID=3880 RepID=A0A072TFN7_MEDTR|nr:hypothetical protein MTR_0368s0040 [Medicago truncatula]